MNGRTVVAKQKKAEWLGGNDALILRCPEGTEVSGTCDQCLE